MIKFYFFFILFLAFSTSSQSQDLIVTHKGDSLNCIINEVGDNVIRFSLKRGNEEKKLAMSQTLIKYYELNYYSKPKVGATTQAIVEDYTRQRIQQKISKFRFAANGGWSYLTAKIIEDAPAEVISYYEELRTGYNMAVDAEYFFSKYIGCGLTFSRFRTKNSLYPVYIKNNTTGQIKSGALKDDITIHYFGPSFFARFFTKNKATCFLPYASIGYLTYKDKATLVDDFIISGDAIGRKAGIVMEYFFEPELAFGIDASFTSGLLTEYTLESSGTKQTVKLKSEEYSNISRLDFSFGIRYSF